MKRIFYYHVVSFFVFAFLFIACTKQLPDDLFTFQVNFFSFTLDANQLESELDESVNFTIDLDENDISTDYTLIFESSLEGVFNYNGDSYTSGQQASIFAGQSNITYQGNELGDHRVSFTITNSEEDIQTESENAVITYEDIDGNTMDPLDFEIKVDFTTDDIATGNETILTLTLDEGEGVPDNTEYILILDSSLSGELSINGNEYDEDEVEINSGRTNIEYTGNVEGEHSITLTVTNSYETPITKSEAVALSYLDVLPGSPTIELNGEETITLNVEDPYDETATVSDGQDHDIELIITGDFTGTSEQGRFEIIYNATDSDGNRAIEKRRIIIVEPVLITGISIAPSPITLNMGENLELLDVVISPSNATNERIIWSSENNNVATIDNNTLIITAVNEGRTVITATATDGSNIEVEVEVEVVIPNTAPTVEITEFTSSGFEEDTFNFVAVVDDPDGDSLIVTYFNGDTQLSTDRLAFSTEFSPGEYIIRVEVSDQKGGVAEDFVEIEVLESSLSNSLLLYYPFDGDINDASSNGYDATNNGGAPLTTDRFGNANRALLFDGVNDYLDLPNVAALKPDLPVSFSFWANYDNEVNSSVFNTSYQEGENTGVYFNSQSSTGNYAIGYSEGSSAFTASQRRTYVVNQTIDPNVWHHIVVIVNSALDMKIYIDGVDNGGSYSGTGGNLLYSDGAGSIGRHSVSSTPSYFKGALDEFRYWDREITEDEVIRLFELD